jgi:fructose-1,6-bisphosphatase/inositol monophosphatase family enzyme
MNYVASRFQVFVGHLAISFYEFMVNIFDVFALLIIAEYQGAAIMGFKRIYTTKLNS